MNRLSADSSTQSRVTGPLWLIARSRFFVESFGFIAGIFIGLQIGFILAYLYLVMPFGVP